MMAEARRCYHLGLIGHPLGHSMSPQLHHAALQSVGFAGEYQLFAIPPGEEGLKAIVALIDDLREHRINGLNVTIPHKQAVIPLMDQLTEVAAVVGAVNTIFRDESGQVIGDNTDVPGFLRDVQQLTGESNKGTAIVLGAGGSARAVVYALARAGWQVRILARRLEQAKCLASAFGAIHSISADPLDLNALEKNAPDCTLLVNTTPLGMYPNTRDCPWPTELPLPEHSAVYDLIYNPATTQLIRRARQQGLSAANGAGMLVAQAALAFQRWTGIEAPFQVMREALLLSTNENSIQ